MKKTVSKKNKPAPKTKPKTLASASKPSPKKAPPTKKSNATARVSSAKRSGVPVGVKTTVAELPWGITLIIGHAGAVFGIATDQRLYRWCTKTALWVIHKEGISATTNA